MRTAQTIPSRRSVFFLKYIVPSDLRPSGATKAAYQSIIAKAAFPTREAASVKKRNVATVIIAGHENLVLASSSRKNLEAEKLQRVARDGALNCRTEGAGHNLHKN